MGDWFKSVLDYVRAWLVSVFISSRQEALAYLDRKVKEADEYTDFPGRRDLWEAESSVRCQTH